MAQKTLQNFYDAIGTRVPMLFKYQFLCSFSFEKTGPFAQFDTSNIRDGLSLLCTSITIPKRSIEAASVNFYAKKFNLPGTQKFDHTWDAKYILTNNLDTFTTIKMWLLKFSSLARQSGGERRIPNVDINLDLLNQFSELPDRGDKNSAPRIVLKGVYPTKVSMDQLKYSDSEATATNFNVTWTYQYSFINEARIDNIDVDPLQNHDVIMY